MSGSHDFVGDYSIKQGSDTTKTITLTQSDTAMDLTGYTARMQIRPSVKSDTLLDDLTTENSRIVITSAEGKVELKFPSATSSKYDWLNGVYDLELYVGSDPVVVTRILQGKIEVDPETTRE